jgi:hypothetical protein
MPTTQIDGRRHGFRPPRADRMPGECAAVNVRIALWIILAAILAVALYISQTPEQQAKWAMEDMRREQQAQDAQTRSELRAARERADSYRRVLSSGRY